MIALLLVMTAFVAAIFTDHAVGVKAAAPTVDTYDNIMNAYKAHQQAIGESSVDHYDYPDNSTNAVFKKPEQLSGYVPDKDLAKNGGKYVRKSLMTYKQYVNLGLENGVRHDIDPERMIWVFTSRFSGKHEFGEATVDNGEVTSAYDAETGDMLSVGYNGVNVVSNGCDCKSPQRNHDQ
jgi:hypothetical protein